MHLRQLEGVLFVNRRYTKGVPFLSKMVCKRIGGGRLADPLRTEHFAECSSCPFGLSLRPAARSCVFFCCFLLSHFTLFAFSRIQLKCCHFPCIKVLSPLFHLCKFGYYSCDTSRVSVRPIKTFLHDKPRRKFFPCTLVRNLFNFVTN